MDGTLVKLEDVVVRLGGRELLGGVSLAIREGASWAVLGGNGAGKSSLLRVLRGDLWPFPSGRRTWALDGTPTESPIGARERIGLVSAERQDEFTRREWDLRAERVVLGGFTDSVYPQEDATPAQAAAISEVMDRLGIAHLTGRPVLELSTGEARRVLLARALVIRPRLLLLDEACNGLDAVAQREFLALVGAVARSGTPVVMATHRPEEVVPEIANVLVMERGRVARTGGRELLTARTAHLPSLPAQRGERDRVRGGRGRTDHPGAQSPLLRLTRVSVHHDDGSPALHDVDWEWLDGESWAVLGPNGAGKSSLLKLVAGELGPMPGGAVERRGFGPHADRWEIGARIGLVSPELQARHRHDLLAEHVVVSGLRDAIGIDGEPDDAERAAAAEAMARAGAAHLAGRHIHAISYGELRRLLVARALVRRPRMLLLDEPFSSLDPGARAALAADLEALAADGVALLVATHHPEELGPSVNRVLRLEGGRVVASGPRAPEGRAW